MKAFASYTAFQIRQFSYKSNSSFDNVTEELITPITHPSRLFNTRMFKFQTTPTWYPMIYRKHATISNDADPLHEMQYTKLWNLPVDNEEGKNEKFSESFDEHVFLKFDPSGLPEDGSFETFLSTVVVGLQRNPYMTLQEKKKQIEFFKDYFSKYKDLKQ